jgi:UDP-hydrolysing UDP-N-acetyl-D-glucosamine 2-epimerase
MRSVALLTTGRQDYGILRPLCVRLASDPRFDASLFVGGMHLGRTRQNALAAIEADGLPIAARLDETSGEGAAQAGAMVRQIADALARLRPEAMVLVGDRSETAAAALASTLARVPIVHLHGGEETEGAIDNAFRHAITKLAHLHLVSHPDHAARVRQLGEPDENIHVVGAPGLDNLHRTDLPNRAALERFLGLPLREPVVVVTLHPTTLGDDPHTEARALTRALASLDATYVITLPNNDRGAAETRKELERFVAAGDRRVAIEALGDARYHALLREAHAMIGNSSSGLIEAPIYGLPVVNVGDRQLGRLRAANVLDTRPDAEAIAAALRRALAPAFRASLVGMNSPYGDGHSAPRIIELLAAWEPPNPPRKRFVKTL